MRANETPVRSLEVDLTSFGSRITRLRKEKSWSGRALARRLGLKPERLRRLEKGLRQPFLSELTRLAAELEVSLDALVYGAGIEAPAEPATPPSAPPVPGEGRES